MRQVMCCRSWRLLIILMAGVSVAVPSWGSSTLAGFTDSRDAVIVGRPDGSIAMAANADTLLVPASILKLITALVAMDALGDDYRFPTDFAIVHGDRLRVTGYGDPLFISEAIRAASSDLCRRLVQQGVARLGGIDLKDSYFAAPLSIPGVSDSDNPYDAPNGALCANFNTVHFSRDPATGLLESAEPQTPLIPFARDRIRDRPTAGRVVLTHGRSDATRYTGHLLRHFLNEAGCTVTGDITIAEDGHASPLPVFRYRSPYPLATVIAKMMRYSNNFIANQLLIAAAAHVDGPPGTLDGGARLARRYLRERLDITRAIIVEGSGISRENRICAADMHRVLLAFKDNRHLMREEGSEYFKTGTLSGVQTRVGFLDVDGRAYSYVVMLNSGRRQMSSVMPAVYRYVAMLSEHPAAGD